MPFPRPGARRRGGLSLPDTPATIPGFTATSSGITIQEDASAALSLNVAGSALALTCTAYPNNTVTPSGITTATPTASPIAPVIAVAGGGSTSTTTVAPVTTTTKAGDHGHGVGGSGGGGGRSPSPPPRAPWPSPAPGPASGSWVSSVAC